jgi:hypothetical protein
MSNLNSMSTRLFETLTFNGFINTTGLATRLDDPSNTLLDLVCVKNFIDNTRLAGVIPIDISDHFIPFAIFSLNNPEPKQPDFFKRRLHNEENLNKFETAMSRESWDSILDSQDINFCFSLLTRTFLKHYSEQIPEERVRFNKRVMPIQKYMTPDLLRSRLEKLKLFRKSKSRSSTHEDVERYKSYLSAYNKSRNKAKKVYFRKRVRDVKGDPRGLWNILKETIGLKNKAKEVEYLEINGQRVEGSVNIANAFNFEFSNIGARLTPEIPFTSKSFYDYLPERYNTNLFFPPINDEILLHFINLIQPKKSYDDDNISMFMINRVKMHLIKPLVHIFNLSFALGVVPDGMKCSRTIAIHKGGVLTLVDHFRGVSLINSFSKIQERIVYSRLLDYLENKNFFYKHQYGFRKNYSTVHCVNMLVNKVSEALASGKVAMAILVDVRKCFDMVDRSILLKKLEHYGVRGRCLDWFKSYFSGRCQRVFFKGINSSTLEDIIYGVLQGSVLGVLLFLIMINDLGLCCKNLIALIFADDNCAYLFADSLDELIDLANHEVPRLIEWYSANRLLIHPDKTKTILFTTPSKNLNLSFDEIQLRSNFPVYINLNNENENDPSKISNLKLISYNGEEKYAKHLGVLIDPILSYKSHFEKLYKKVNRAVFSLKQMKHLLDREHLMLLYNAYIKSAIEYACALFSGLPASMLKPIIILQKRAIRIIFGAGYRAETADFFRELGILPLDKLIEFNIGKIMFDYKKGRLPNSFNNTWKLNSEHHVRNLRNNNDFFIRTLPTEFLKNLPLYKFPDIWNKLPNQIKLIDNRKQFMKDYKQLLLNSIRF